MLQDALDAAIEGATGGVGLGIVAVAAGALLLSRTGKPVAERRHQELVRGAR